jgi:hypothetical protein
MFATLSNYVAYTAKTQSILKVMAGCASNENKFPCIVRVEH